MLIDTSAWVEFLRATGSPTHLAVRAALEKDVMIRTCDPIVMEVLAGGRSEKHVADLRGLMARAQNVRVVAADWDEAARIYRTGRRQGITVRKLIDCLIAAVALRTDQPVLHHDVDFDAITRITPLVTSRG